MKKLVMLLALTVPMISFAAPKTGAELQEAQAVLKNAEIANVLSAITSARKLACAPAAADDVVIGKIGQGDGADTFEIAYGCNAVDGGANVHRIDFSGFVSVTDGSHAVWVNMTSVQIELSE